ncbi:regulatory protein RecX [Pedobacter sp. MC2016-24]|uniref:regulatory protein RecX n=1 Tax=Pedobacter sp. MC2016-24 TaxID=2780090 RepID=UPI001881AE13|nr:regulatory protein RecX [Pedobacter sp. MC2016-24]MBE9602697.1 regulatory protein RecX [Pedobacter sp. MC2016-24]
MEFLFAYLLCNIAEVEETDKKKIRLDRKTALAKAEHYCAYQERSQQELRNKLYEWGQWSDDVEEIISELIQTNFLNEERFTQAYVSGKFKMKHWGKIKIRQGLKLKNVPDKMISNALKGIDYDEYLATILMLAEKKAGTIVEKDAYKKRYKLVSYLLGRGFENDSIIEVLKANGLY